MTGYREQGLRGRGEASFHPAIEIWPDLDRADADGRERVRRLLDEWLERGGQIREQKPTPGWDATPPRSTSTGHR